MEFHPQKCSVLRVSRARSPIQFLYRLKGHLLELQDSSKYFGVDVQFSLSWKNHTDNVIKKANSILGYLRRNHKIASKDAICCLPYHSNLEYCCSVWSPHHKKQNLKWFRDGLRRILHEDTEILAVSPQNFNICSGNHWNQDVKDSTNAILQSCK